MHEASERIQRGVEAEDLVHVIARGAQLPDEVQRRQRTQGGERQARRPAGDGKLSAIAAAVRRPRRGLRGRKPVRGAILTSGSSVARGPRQSPDNLARMPDPATGRSSQIVGYAVRPSVDVVVPFAGSEEALGAVCERMAALRLRPGDSLSWSTTPRAAGWRRVEPSAAPRAREGHRAPRRRTPNPGVRPQPGRRARERRMARVHRRRRRTRQRTARSLLRTSP